MPDKCLDCPVPSADMDGFIVSGPGGAPRSDSEGVSGSEGPFAKEAPQTGHVTIMGTLGADGNPGSLPDVPQVGWAYVAKDAGTYGGVQATEGDVVYCVSLNPVRWGVLQADSDDSGQDLVRASLSFSADPLPSLSLETETAAGVSSVQTVDVSALAVDESVLHKTGAETVSGEKVFSGSQTTAAGNVGSLLVIKDPDLVKGETPESNHYLSLGFIDSTGNSYVQDVSSRLAVVEYKSPSVADSNSFSQLVDLGFNGGVSARLQVGHGENNIPYAAAPSTSEDRTNSTDIVTRDYLPKSKAIPQFPDLWNWQKTKKAGAVMFKPVPESDLESVVDFLFTETPPVSGDKGLENPSTITAVSSVAMRRCGKNIVSFPYQNDSCTVNDVTFTVNPDGSILVNGTATDNAVFRLSQSFNNNPILLKGGSTYVLSGCPSGGNVATYKLYLGSYDNAFNAVSDTGSSVTVTPSKDSFVNFYIQINSGVTVSNLVFKPQLELSTTATAFEPYEGNDYTIQLGDTYYGGSLDVATGVLTVTWVGIVYDGTETITKSVDLADGTPQYNLPVPSYAAGGAALGETFTHFPFGYTAGHAYVRTSGSTGFRVYPVGYDTLESFTAWVASQYAAGTPLTVAYKPASPITVQLTPTQIRSLPALDKYEPRINTVYTDQEAVQVGYQRFYDENRIAAVEARLDAIEAQLS